MNQQLISASDSKHGEIAKGRANRDPNASEAQPAQYEALAIRNRNTANQRGRKSSFLESLNNEHSVSAAHTSFCNKQGLQQKKYFKLNNQIPWNKQDYEDALGFRLPCNQMMDRSTTNKYFTHSSPQDMNRMSDTYFKAPNQLRVQPPRVALPLFNSISPNLFWQALSVSGDTQQDSQGNSANEELEPPQVKKDVLTSNSWGATGMPFNVLYLSSRQFKKPVRKPQVAQKTPSSAVTAGSKGKGAAGGGGGRGDKSQQPPAWYYSIIPHLHATYSWRQRDK
jgi:hypothetical protein